MRRDVMRMKGSLEIPLLFERGGTFDLLVLKWISVEHQKRNNQSRKPSFPGFVARQPHRVSTMPNPATFLADGGVSADHFTTSDR